MTNNDVDLQSVFEIKFQEWETLRLSEDMDRGDLTADDVLARLLRETTGNHIYFVSGTGVLGSIQSFRYAYDNAIEWTAYERELQELSDEELATIPFDTLVRGLAR